MIIALDQKGEKIDSKTALSGGEYYCPQCKGKVDFVNANLRVKHFRHSVISNCESEPETEEHIYYKNLIYNELLKLNDGHAELEKVMGGVRPDVFWEATQYNPKRIAFEIQASSVDLKIYEDKLTKYSAKNIFVVYFFVPGDFLNEIDKNIFVLKEIEKRFFLSESVIENVSFAYLRKNYFDPNIDQIYIPSFEYKYAKGRNEICSNRFIIDYKQSQYFQVGQYLEDIINNFPYELMVECEHVDKKYKLNAGKIVRYKEECADCGKFIKWISNKELLKYGLSINT